MAKTNKGPTLLATQLLIPWDNLSLCHQTKRERNKRTFYFKITMCYQWLFGYAWNFLFSSPSMLEYMTDLILHNSNISKHHGCCELRCSKDLSFLENIVSQESPFSLSLQYLQPPFLNGPLVLKPCVCLFPLFTVHAIITH